MDDDRQDAQRGEGSQLDDAESLARRQAALRALGQRQTQLPQAAGAPPARSATRAAEPAKRPRGADGGSRRGVLVGGSILAIIVSVALIAVAVVNLGARRPTTTRHSAP